MCVSLSDSVLCAWSESSVRWSGVREFVRCVIILVRGLH